jgi:hypothetical protein
MPQSHDVFNLFLPTYVHQQQNLYLHEHNSARQTKLSYSILLACTYGWDTYVGPK